MTIKPVSHGETPQSYPRVYTENNCYTPERVVKKDWGVIMIDGTDKRSMPWNRVQSVCEQIPEADACGQGITGGN